MWFSKYCTQQYTGRQSDETHCTIILADRGLLPSIHIHFILRCCPCTVQWGWHYTYVYNDYPRSGIPYRNHSSGNCIIYDLNIVYLMAVMQWVCCCSMAHLALKSLSSQHGGCWWPGSYLATCHMTVPKTNDLSLRLVWCKHHIIANHKYTNPNLNAETTFYHPSKNFSHIFICCSVSIQAHFVTKPMNY